MPVSVETTRLLTEEQRSALLASLEAARRHDAEEQQGEALRRAKEAGLATLVTAPLTGGRRVAAAGDEGTKGSADGAPAAALAKAEGSAEGADEAAADKMGEGGPAHRRTLAEDWASLLLALHAPVAWCGATWRLFYLVRAWGSNGRQQRRGGSTGGARVVAVRPRSTVPRCAPCRHQTCLNGFTFFTPLIIRDILGATVRLRREGAEGGPSVGLPLR